MSLPTIWPMGAELGSDELIDTLLDDDTYVADMKISGERLTLNFEDGIIRAFTRSGSKSNPDKPIEVTHRWPQLQRIATSVPNGTILDGEAYSPLRREEEIAGLLNYQNTAPMPDDMIFICFDCLYYKGESLLNHKWHERRDIVNYIARIVNNPILRVTVVTYEYKREFYEDILADGGEGIVLKNIFATYKPGKKTGHIWVKAKKSDTYDCIITGIKPGKNKYTGMVGSFELSQYKKMNTQGELTEYKLFKVCNAFGLSDEIRKDATAHPDRYIGRVVVVEAYERVHNSVTLKQPRIKSIRPEGSKDPKDCIIEEK